MDIHTKHELQNVHRELAELRAKTNRLPVQIAKATPATFSVTVYLFANCTTPERILYLDNPEIASHAEGGDDEDTPVAIIQIDGVQECWQLIGPAPRCKTGECANIVSWKSSCAASCYNLTPCEGGSPFVVRDVDCADGWAQYLNRVVTLIVPGFNDDVEACFEVTEADACADVRDDILPSFVTQVFRDCESCGCYELTDCDDNVVYLKVDLWAHVFGPQGFEGETLIGQWIKFKGICYEITDFVSPCTETVAEWGGEIGTCCNFGFGSSEDCCPEIIQSCNACCYLLTPCPDQEGDPEPKYYRTTEGDLDLTAFVDKETGASNGRTLMLADQICYTVSIPEEACPDEGVILGLGTVLEEYDSCAECGITCWERCDAPGTYIRTYSRMPIAYRDGETAVKRAEDGYCYKYESSLGSCGEPEIVPFTIENAFEEGEDSCAICQNPKVKLTPSCGGCSNCSNEPVSDSPEATVIVTDDESLFPHVGKYVKVEGICHLVEWTTDSVTQEEVCWTGPFESCGECRAGVTKITVIALRDGAHKHVTLEGVFNVCAVGDWDGECDE